MFSCKIRLVDAGIAREELMWTLKKNRLSLKIPGKF
jgi:hypothetical protein